MKRLNKQEWFRADITLDKEQLRAEKSTAVTQMWDVGKEDISQQHIWVCTKPQYILNKKPGMFKNTNLKVQLNYQDNICELYKDIFK